MKSKSIVFFVSVGCLFLSHCTDVGSNSYRQPSMLNVGLEIEIQEINRKLNRAEEEIDKNRKFIRELREELKLEIPLQLKVNSYLGATR